MEPEPICKSLYWLFCAVNDDDGGNSLRNTLVFVWLVKHALVTRHFTGFDNKDSVSCKAYA